MRTLLVASVLLLAMPALLRAEEPAPEARAPVEDAALAPLPLPRALRGDGPRISWVAPCAWLALHQALDGTWSTKAFGRLCDGLPVAREAALPGAGTSDADLELTALTTVALLDADIGFGEDPISRATMRGVEALRARQDADGRFVAAEGGSDLATQALATMALTGALLVSEDERLEMPTRAALARLLAAWGDTATLPGEAADGGGDWAIGWSLWALGLGQTLERLRRKGGLAATADEERLDRAIGRIADLLEARADAEAAAGGEEEDTRHGLAVALALLARIHAGVDPRKDPACERYAAWLQDHLPRPEGLGADEVYAWFGTLAAYEVGGNTWKLWSDALKGAVIDTQHEGPLPCDLAGSWAPRGATARRLGRVGSTALGALMVSIYYRYGAGPAKDRPPQEAVDHDAAPAEGRDRWLARIEMLERAHPDRCEVPEALRAAIEALPATSLALPTPPADVVPPDPEDWRWDRAADRQAARAALEAAFRHAAAGRYTTAATGLLPHAGRDASVAPRAFALLARLQEAAGADDLALLAWELALAFEPVGREGHLPWIVATDYRRFLVHVTEGRRTTVFHEFAAARLASLEAEGPWVKTRDRGVIVQSLDPGNAPGVIVRDEAGRPRYPPARPAPAEGLAPRPDLRGTVRFLAADAPAHFEVVGPWADATPPHACPPVLVVDVLDWGRPSERTTWRVLDLEGRHDVWKAPAAR